MQEKTKKKVFTKNETLFFPPNQVKTKKKGLHQVRNTFSSNSSGDLRLDAHRSQIIGAVADEDHTQTIGGDAAKLLGGYIPPGFWHPWLQANKGSCFLFFHTK